MKNLDWFKDLDMSDKTALLDKKMYTLSSKDYQDWQEHSEIIDKLAGFKINDIEEELVRKAKEEHENGGHRTWGPSLHNGHQTWVGLSPKQLQTTYKELYSICCELGEPQGIMDLGAGYGRLGLVANSFFKDCQFIGHEYVQERVDHGNDIFSKLGLSNLSLFQTDICSLDFTLSACDVFFIYDFGQRSEMDQVLKNLNKLWTKRSFKLVARGRGIRSIISNWHPWLNSDETIHTNTYSIYSL